LAALLAHIVAVFDSFANVSVIDTSTAVNSMTLDVAVFILPVFLLAAVAARPLSEPVTCDTSAVQCSVQNFVCRRIFKMQIVCSIFRKIRRCNNEAARSVVTDES
jgi:hypothetical protein